jgi:WD40 repeat protein
MRHTGPVTALALSPDGSTLWSCGEDGTTRSWDAASGKPRGEPLRLEGAVVAFSPDVRLALVGPVQQGRGQVRLWDLTTGQPRGGTWSLQGRLLAVAFSPDSRLVLLSEGQVVWLCDTVTGQVLYRFLPSDGMGAAQTVAFSPDGETFLTGSADHSVRWWQTATRMRLGSPLPHPDVVEAVSFRPDGRLFVGSTLQEAQLRDADPSGLLGRFLRHEGRVRSLTFSPDRRTILTGSDDRTARLWDLATGQPAAGPLVHGAAVTHVAFSPNGQLVLSWGEDGTARLWDCHTGQPRGGPWEHEGELRSAQFSADGATVVVHTMKPVPQAVSAFGSAAFVSVWDVARGRLRHRFGPLAGRVSPDLRCYLTNQDASPPEKDVVQLWDLETGKPVGPPLTHLGQLARAVFHPEGRSLVLCSEGKEGPGELRLWDPRTAQALGPPLPLEDWTPLAPVEFSPDRRILAIGRQLRDADTGHPLGPPLRFEGLPDRDVWPYQAIFSQDSRLLLLTGSRDTERDFVLQIWDVPGGQPIGAAIVGLQESSTPILSPDSRTVLFHRSDRTAQLVDATTGQLVGAPLSHQGLVVHLGFSPDSHLALTTSIDRTVRLWDVATGRPVSPPLRHYGSNIARAQISADGRTLATWAPEEPQVRLWPVPRPLAGRPETVMLWTEVLTGLELDSRGAVRLLDRSSWEERRRRLAQSGDLLAGESGYSPEETQALQERRESPP